VIAATDDLQSQVDGKASRSKLLKTRGGGGGEGGGGVGGGGVGGADRGAAAVGHGATDEAEMGQLFEHGAADLRPGPAAPAGGLPGKGDCARAAASEVPAARKGVPGAGEGLPGAARGG